MPVKLSVVPIVLVIALGACTDHTARYLHELYSISDPTCTSRVTVPTLWDAETRTVVSNESSEIIRMFNSAFVGIAPATPDYCPDGLVDTIDAMNAKVLDGVNNAVNECGRSTSQAAYEVGPEYVERFIDEDPEHSRFFAGGTGGRAMFDLPGFCLHRLREAAIGSAEWTGHCTYADEDRFYSYRRTVHRGEPDYGRLVAAIAL